MLADAKRQGRMLQSFEPPSRSRSLLRRIWRERLMYLLILPGVCYFLIFVYLPLLGNIIAFQDYKPFLASLKGPIEGFLVGPWVGLAHFQTMWSDPDFRRALVNTVQIEALQLVFSFPAPLALALLLNSMISERIKRTMQTIVYLPYFLSWVIVIAIWQQVFGGVGAVNQILGEFGQGPINVMQNPDIFKPLVVIQGIWKDAGWGTIIFLAALTKVDISLYEAAVIDGAGGWRRLIDVTLPAIRGIIVLLLILRLGNMFSVGFEQYFLQRQAVGADASEVLDTFVYYRGIQAGDFSFATAVGMIRSIVGLCLILSANWMAKRLGEEGVL
jgi:putative aldouronate transport system permease protein